MAVPSRALEELPVVLVAEDDQDVRDLLVFRLEMAGYRVVTAFDGEDAVRLLSESVPDLIILDVAMPRMSGVDVLRHVRMSDSMRHLPVIMLTAKVQEQDLDRGFTAGADDYIKKPFSLQELVTRANSLLARR